MLTRRHFIKHSALLGASSFLPFSPAPPQSNFWIGACDWSIGKTATPEAFDLAKQIGLDGLQVSFNTQRDEAYLTKPDNVAAIKAAAQRTGVRIASLAIGELNRVPYKSEPRTEAWVSQSIDAAKALGVTVVLLAFFSKNDLRQDATGKKAVIERLKAVAPKAERMGITLGIESYLSAEEHLDIIQAVGSKAIRVYYDFRNSTDAGYDIYHEIPLLKDYICEIHIKENGHLIGKGPLDWPRIRKALDGIGYRGWMQIEGAVPSGKGITESYVENLQYLRSVFA
jgi:sugar phosphate isomerase/epimerase